LLQRGLKALEGDVAAIGFADEALAHERAEVAVRRAPERSHLREASLDARPRALAELSDQLGLERRALLAEIQLLHAGDLAVLAARRKHHQHQTQSPEHALFSPPVRDESTTNEMGYRAADARLIDAPRDRRRCVRRLQLRVERPR